MTIKMVVFISTLIIFIGAIIGYLGTVIQVLDLSQSVTSGDVEEATSAIKNFTENQVRDEVKGMVNRIYLAMP